MSADLALLAGAVMGMAAGSLLIPATARQLAAATSRANDGFSVPAPTLVTRQRVAIIVASGLIPGLVLLRSGWSYVAIPPLLLFLGLVQLAYCDLSESLLPKAIVYATTACVVASALVVSATTDHWHRLVLATLLGAGLFLVFLIVNLVNPVWMAFGDVRLAPVVGFGLGWASALAVLEAFFLANLLAAVVGVSLMLAHRSGRKATLPFGLYLTLATAVVLLKFS